MSNLLTSECPGPRDGRSVESKRARSRAYAQNERDYDPLADAAASRRIGVETGL
jgi:hypothetical protein